MRTAARPNRINIDLGEYKSRWLAYCRHNQLTPSEAFRLIVAKLTAEIAIASMSDTHARDKAKVRKEIRLTPLEAARIEAIAVQEGYSLTRWIIALIRARLDSTAQFGQRELEALGASNLNLLRIGRNVNQIARAVNSGNTELLAMLQPVLQELIALVQSHTRTVSRLIDANLERWRGKS